MLKMSWSIQKTPPKHVYTGGHRTRVAAVTLDNMTETRSPLQQVYGKFSPFLFVTAAQLLWVDCQCYGTHWRGIPSCSDSASRRNPGLKLRRRGCRSCLFSRGRGCRSALTRVPLYADERRASLILRTAAGAFHLPDMQNSRYALKSCWPADRIWFSSWPAENIIYQLAVLENYSWQNVHISGWLAADFSPAGRFEEKYAAGSFR